MGLLYLSYLHSNIRLKLIINWIFKKCNPVKSQTQIPSFELYTKWLISNRTKAIVPKPVIWSSMWSEFASLWKLRIRMKLILIQRRKKKACWCWKRMTTRIAEEVSRNLTQRRLYASDNYSFSVKKIWCLPYFLTTLFQNYSLGEKNDLKKTFRNGERWEIYW